MPDPRARQRAGVAAAVVRGRRQALRLRVALAALDAQATVERGGQVVEGSA